MEFIRALVVHILIGISVASVWRLRHSHYQFRSWIWLALVVTVGSFVGSFFDTTAKLFIADYQHLLGNFSIYPPLIFSVLFLKMFVLVRSKHNTRKKRAQTAKTAMKMDTQ